MANDIDLAIPRSMYYNVPLELSPTHVDPIMRTLRNHSRNVLIVNGRILSEKINNIIYLE